MKKHVFCLLLLLPILAWTQAQTFFYPLAEDFDALTPTAPTLIQIPNNGGLTGEFVTRTVPTSTCPDGGNADGYFFEDDAGLQFDNPQEFIGCEYTLQMIFQVDEFIGPPPWVRLLSFTHTDDVGIYLYFTIPDSATLDFWPFALVGEPNFFVPADFYQLTLVRDCSGMVTVYINGDVFASYDDTLSQSYVPQAPDNYIVFFRDHPSVLADEASPGFVSNIFIADYAWTEAIVGQSWANFCPTLTGIDRGDASQATVKLYPNPAQTELFVEVPTVRSAPLEWRISDLAGRTLRVGNLTTGQNRIELQGLASGSYLFLHSGDNGVAAQTFQVVSTR